MSKCVDSKMDIKMRYEELLKDSCNINKEYYQSLCNYEIPEDKLNHNGYKHLKEIISNDEIDKEFNMTYLNDCNGNKYKTIMIAYDDILTNSFVNGFLESLEESYGKIKDRLEIHLRDNGKLMLVKRTHSVVKITMLEEYNIITNSKNKYEVLDEDFNLENSSTIFNQNKDNLYKTMKKINQSFRHYIAISNL